MHLRYLIEPVCVQYGRLFSQKNAFRIQRSRAQERGLSRGNLSPLTRFWFGVPDGSQDPMGRGGRTAAGRAARSVTEGQLDSSGGCARRGGAKGTPRRRAVQIMTIKRLAPPEARRNHVTSIRRKATTPFAAGGGGEIFFRWGDYPLPKWRWGGNLVEENR